MNVQDIVLKKNVTDGIHSGEVVEAWSHNGQEYIRVLWDTGYRAITFPTSVLPATDANRAMLAEKLKKRQHRAAKRRGHTTTIQQAIEKVMLESSR